MAQTGLKVCVIEKKPYPHHKVCGEYISNEVLPYLKSLGADPMTLGAKEIRYLQLSTASGKLIETPLPLGGFGLSRYAFDQFLYEKAQAHGAQFVLGEPATAVTYRQDHFEVRVRSGQTYHARFVIGAYGKRARLDQQLQRRFFSQQSPYVAVKQHWEGEFPDDRVALHNFPGGYCGVSKVETNHLNLCYLTKRELLQKYRTPEKMTQELLALNPYLKELLTHIRPAFQPPLVISQVSFAPKPAVEQHILMSGDTAGLIPPLCGNGMAMAIHSARMLSERIGEYFHQHGDRGELEKRYQADWNAAFRVRLWGGRQFQKLFGTAFISEYALELLRWMPGLLPPLIRLTHGKPISPLPYEFESSV